MNRHGFGQSLGKLLWDESGQAMVEKALLVVLLALPVIFIFEEVLDGFVSYYSYIVGVLCLPIP